MAMVGIKTWPSFPLRAALVLSHCCHPLPLHHCHVLSSALSTSPPPSCLSKHWNCDQQGEIFSLLRGKW